MRGLVALAVLGLVIFVGGLGRSFCGLFGARPRFFTWAVWGPAQTAAT